ncbi:nitrogen permease regulator of amino acid transport activity 3 domain-containing protein [Phthorimaea operculella]|nr:nitrogen permease regulator of amino acid transport activity 3 domain-containing protein [Phthorimaea operculella]
MEVNPLNIFFVKSDSKGDRLLFRYPYTTENKEDERKQKKCGRHNPYAVNSSQVEDLLQNPQSQMSNIYKGQLSGFTDEMLSTLFAVKAELCNQKFELKVNDVRFVGHPTLLPYRANKDDNTAMILINIVFALQASASHSIVKCYYDLSKRLGKALRHEEKRCSYLTEEMKIMLAAHDEVSAMDAESGGNDDEDDNRRTSISSALSPDSDSPKSAFHHILQRSSLAVSMKKVFEELTSTGIVQVRINKWVLLSFCLPHKAHQIHNRGLIIEPETIDKCLQKLRPYHGILLMVNPNELLASIPLDGSAALLRLIKTYSPLKSLQTLAIESDLTLTQSGVAASHQDLQPTQEPADPRYRVRSYAYTGKASILLDGRAALLRLIKTYSPLKSLQTLAIESDLTLTQVALYDARLRYMTLGNASIPLDGSAALLRLIKTYSPLKSLQTLAIESDLTLTQVFQLTGHLVYWAKATVIYPLCEGNVYVVAPSANAHVMSPLVHEFAKQFPGLCLLQMLGEFSLPAPLWKRLLLQLHTYVQFNEHWGRTQDGKEYFCEKHNIYNQSCNISFSSSLNQQPYLPEPVQVTRMFPDSDEDYPENLNKKEFGYTKPIIIESDLKGYNKYDIDSANHSFDDNGVDVVDGLIKMNGNGCEKSEVLKKTNGISDSETVAKKVNSNSVDSGISNNINGHHPDINSESKAVKIVESLSSRLSEVTLKSDKEQSSDDDKCESDHEVSPYSRHENGYTNGMDKRNGVSLNLRLQSEMSFQPPTVWSMPACCDVLDTCRVPPDSVSAESLLDTFSAEERAALEKVPAASNTDDLLLLAQLHKKAEERAALEKVPAASNTDDLLLLAQLHKKAEERAQERAALEKVPAASNTDDLLLLAQLHKKAEERAQERAALEKVPAASNTDDLLLLAQLHKKDTCRVPPDSVSAESLLDTFSAEERAALEKVPAASNTDDLLLLAQLHKKDTCRVPPDSVSAESLLDTFSAEERAALEKVPAASNTDDLLLLAQLHKKDTCRVPPDSVSAESLLDTFSAEERAALEKVPLRATLMICCFWLSYIRKSMPACYDVLDTCRVPPDSVSAESLLDTFSAEERAALEKVPAASNTDDLLLLAQLHKKDTCRVPPDSVSAESLLDTFSAEERAQERAALEKVPAASNTDDLLLLAQLHKKAESLLDTFSAEERAALEKVPAASNTDDLLLLAQLHKKGNSTIHKYVDLLLTPFSGNKIKQIGHAVCL